MDKHTIITLKNQGNSNREVERLTGIHRKTVAKYWKEYLAKNEALERLRVAHCSKVAKVPVLVNNEEVDCYHVRKCVFCASYAKFVAAIQKMPIA